MKVAQYTRIPKRLTEMPDELLKWVRHIKNELLLSDLCKRRKCMNFSVHLSEQDGDNFIKELVSVVLTAMSYKRPRIAAGSQPRKKSIIRFISLRYKPAKYNNQ